MQNDYVEHMGIMISKEYMIWIFDGDGGYWCGAMHLSRKHAATTQQWLEYECGVPCCIRDARGVSTPFDLVDA